MLYIFTKLNMRFSTLQELQPIVVSLSLPLPAHVTVDHNSPDMVQIGQTYNVNIHIKPVSLSIYLSSYLSMFP